MKAEDRFNEVKERYMTAYLQKNKRSIISKCFYEKGYVNIEIQDSPLRKVRVGKFEAMTKMLEFHNSKKNHEGCSRAYVRSSKTWYYDSNSKISIYFGMYNIEDGGTSGEMEMVWIDLGGRLSARLESFHDSWIALSLFPDLIEKMGKSDIQVSGNSIQEEEFVKLLDECGFKDITEYECPYKSEVDEGIEDIEMVDLSIPKDMAEKLKLGDFIKK